jgi:hypothetical protein
LYDENGEKQLGQSVEYNWIGSDPRVFKFLRWINLKSRLFLVMPRVLVEVRKCHVDNQKALLK